jgi:hypothetical protein
LSRHIFDYHRPIHSNDDKPLEYLYEFAMGRILVVQNSWNRNISFAGPRGHSKKEVGYLGYCKNY